MASNGFDCGHTLIILPCFRRSVSTPTPSLKRQRTKPKIPLRVGVSEILVFVAEQVRKSGSCYKNSEILREASPSSLLSYGMLTRMREHGYLSAGDQHPKDDLAHLANSRFGYKRRNRL